MAADPDASEPPRETIGARLALARSRIRRLTPQDAAAAQAAGAIIVDTRDSADRRAEGGIDGAIVATRNTLEWRADPTAELPHPVLSDFGRELIVVCNDGYSSSLAADDLRRLGHATAADVIGGFRAWAQVGMPTTSAPADRTAPGVPTPPADVEEHAPPPPTTRI